MTSKAKIRANRENARASTGPKTVDGRNRSAKNALRHALSLPVSSDPSWNEDVQELTELLAGPYANPEIVHIARVAAEAQLNLLRVRYARLQFLSGKLREPYYESRATRRTKCAVVRKFLSQKLPDISEELMAEYLTVTPQGPEKFSIILMEELKRLQAFDRYERRALSRRKFAIRDLDGAKARQQL